MAERPDGRAALINALDLAPHPEGGWFREVYRSPRDVRPTDDRPARRALTVIYFLLGADEHSRWHVVRSDEQWTWLDGAPLHLHILDDDWQLRTATLGPAAGGDVPTTVVPAGQWQAARSAGGYTLVTCTVGPGFDFADFALSDTRPHVAERIRAAAPHLAWML